MLSILSPFNTSLTLIFPANAFLVLCVTNDDSLVQKDTMETGRYGRKGSPWEFNLRDVFRWCELMLREQQRLSGVACAEGADPCDDWEPWAMVDTLYVQRMRTRADRDAILARFNEAFPVAFRETSCERPGRSADRPQPHGDLNVRAGGIGTHPVVMLTPEWMQVGRTLLPRGCWSDAPSAGRNGNDGMKAGVSMRLLLRRPLQALAR